MTLHGGAWQTGPLRLTFAPQNQDAVKSWDGLPISVEVSAELATAWRCAAWEMLRLEPDTAPTSDAWGSAALRLVRSSRQVDPETTWKELVIEAR